MATRDTSMFRCRQCNNTATKRCDDCGEVICVQCEERFHKDCINKFDLEAIQEELQSDGDINDDHLLKFVMVFQYVLPCALIVIVCVASGKLSATHGFGGLFAGIATLLLAIKLGLPVEVLSGVGV
eukprot:m.12322 g.12322  ORF g.12322 m.12322 type:complete len:126 (-) comp4635_c0_seq1:308-685(-)